MYTYTHITLIILTCKVAVDCHLSEDELSHGINSTKALPTPCPLSLSLSLSLSLPLSLSLFLSPCPLSLSLDVSPLSMITVRMLSRYEHEHSMIGHMPLSAIAATLCNRTTS